MKINPPQKLKDIAALLDAQFTGSPDHIVSGLNEIHKVEHGDIVFVDHPKYYDKALSSRATTIIINKNVPCPEGKGLIICDDPFSAYNKLVSHFQPVQYSLSPMSHSATVGANTVIMPGAYVGNHVTIGDNCVIHPNVTIYDHCVIGNNVEIHAGAVIGGDAFYYKRRPEKFDKMLSCGRVVIHDDVEIGCATTIDRGVSGDTVIGQGTKIDNHVHIGHDTVVGKMCLFAAHVGIAGVVTIEDNVTLWGQVGVASDLTIGKGAVVMAQSGIHKDMEGGKSYFGSPAGEAREKMKELISVKRIPDILEKLK
jgi:UDP-3-O-[3-hydroxymyristoyl] glucosamine N-acyltransferase